MQQKQQQAMRGDVEMEGMRTRENVAEEENLEEGSLLLVRTSREASTALARAAYRTELATKRALLLALLIVPVLLIIIAWHLFDSNAHWGAPSPPARPAPFLTLGVEHP